MRHQHAQVRSIRDYLSQLVDKRTPLRLFAAMSCKALPVLFEQVPFPLIPPIRQHSLNLNKWRGYPQVDGDYQTFS